MLLRKLCCWGNCVVGETVLLEKLCCWGNCAVGGIVLLGEPCCCRNYCFLEIGIIVF